MKPFSRMTGSIKRDQQEGVSLKSESDPAPVRSELLTIAQGFWATRTMPTVAVQVNLG